MTCSLVIKHVNFAQPRQNHLLMNSSVVLYQALLVPFCKEFCGQRPMSHWQALSSDFATQSLCIEIKYGSPIICHPLQLRSYWFHSFIDVCILRGTPSKNVWNVLDLSTSTDQVLVVAVDCTVPLWKLGWFGSTAMSALSVCWWGGLGVCDSVLVRLQDV